MGLYTNYNDINIDNQIEEKLKTVTDVILKHVRGVKSIVLTGGFGRGEGSVLYDDRMQVMLLKDLDIVVISDETPHKQVQSVLLEDLYGRFFMDNPEEQLFRFGKFVVDIRYMKESQLNYPDIWFYDLKSNSKILYGKDVRNSVKYDAKDIPLSSGFRILLEKVTGLLGHFSYQYIRERSVPHDEYQKLVYECLKAYVEMGTALCILTKKYRSTYAERMRIVKEIYKQELRELKDELPHLPGMIEAATRFKLKPDYNQVRDDPIKLWFNTRDDLLTVLKYYVKNFTGIAINDWNDLPMIKHVLRKDYYKPLLAAWYFNNFRSRNRFMVDILNVLFNLLTNVEYAKQIRKEHNIFYLKLFLRPITPSLKFFCAAPLILVSIDREGDIRKDYIESAMKELEFCVPIDNDKQANSWDSARDLYLCAYKLYNGPHCIK